HRSPGANPYQTLKNLKNDWEKPETVNKPWKTPNEIYWICGEKTYSELPCKWRESCTLGIIKPSFFTLPRYESNLLGAPL
ncbi:ENR1 protein, partial [Falcunculus frontatus]|nr:ENR1 protein [Falcunculus frontatus]